MSKKQIGSHSAWEATKSLGSGAETNAAKKGSDEFKIAMQRQKRKGKRWDLRVQTKLMEKRRSSRAKCIVLLWWKNRRKKSTLFT